MLRKNAHQHIFSLGVNILLCCHYSVTNRAERSTRCTFCHLCQQHYNLSFPSLVVCVRARVCVCVPTRTQAAKKGKRIIYDGGKSSCHMSFLLNSKTESTYQQPGNLLGLGTWRALQGLNNMWHWQMHARTQTPTCMHARLRNCINNRPSSRSEVQAATSQLRAPIVQFRRLFEFKATSCRYPDSSNWKSL